MREKNFPLLVFLFGLSLGLIGGGAVVYFVKDKELKNMISIDIVPDIVEKVFGLMKKNEATIKKTENIENFQNNNSPSAEENQSVKNQTNSSALDSLSADSSELFQSEEEIVVLQRDEMISSGTIEIINLDFKNDNNNFSNDSLLAETAEIKPEKKISELKVSWIVEYWSSPVNYKGYRIGKNRFILFGIDPDAPIKAYLFNGDFFLKTGDGVFKLEYSNEFLPFIKTDNNAALSAIAGKS
jgi:hypothetical protein